MAEEADCLAGSNPDYAIQDLYNSIANGNIPSWTLYIQVMTFEEAENYHLNPFDLTKVSEERAFLIADFSFLDSCKVKFFLCFPSLHQ